MYILGFKKPNAPQYPGHVLGYILPEESNNPGTDGNTYYKNYIDNSFSILHLHMIMKI